MQTTKTLTNVEKLNIFKAVLSNNPTKDDLFWIHEDLSYLEYDGDLKNDLNMWELWRKQLVTHINILLPYAQEADDKKLEPFLHFCQTGKFPD